MSFESNDMDALDAQLAELFAQRCGLGEAGRQSLIDGLQNRKTQQQPRRPQPEPLSGMFSTSEAAAHQDVQASSSSPMSASKGPGTPAWVRSEAERRRLHSNLDEAVSVSSSSNGTDKSPAAGNAGGDVRGLSPDEQTTIERYGSIFDRLHDDIDLLVLRCPLVGEVLAGLLRGLADALLPCKSEERELATLEPLQTCVAAIAGIARACPSSSHRRKGTRTNSSAPAVSSHDIRHEAEIEDGCQSNVGRQRQRFSVARPTINTKSVLRGSARADVTPPSAAANIAKRFQLDDAGAARPPYAVIGHGGRKLVAAGRETAFVSEIEGQCREQLRANLATCIDAEVDSRFSALKAQLQACVGNRRPTSVDNQMSVTALDTSREAVPPQGFPENGSDSDPHGMD